MLELISKLNPAENNLVKFFEQFEYMGQTCLVFEMLDNDLYDLLEERQCNPVHLKEIRPIAQQVWNIVILWTFFLILFCPLFFNQQKFPKWTANI